MTDLSSVINDLNAKCLATYGIAPLRIEEDAKKEVDVLAGGYSYRQVLELVQNGADAILEACEQPINVQLKPRIEVTLSGRHLYVANTGSPLTGEGVETLMHSNLSRKRGNQIGRFGLGFKSLLRLGGTLDVFSTSGSIRFDPERCQREIREKFGLAEKSDVPGLRLAWTLDREEAEADDSVVASFPWATTIVRAEVRRTEAIPHLQQEIRTFPRQFLLFMPGALSLTLDTGDGNKRVLRRGPDGEEIVLYDGDSPSRWRVVENPEVRITDEAARSDATHLHARETVPLSWAIPLDAQRYEAGKFWAFFPTNTLTHLPGILNAPWKLNSDRTALIPGAWNTALMQEAAMLVAGTLPTLSTANDPGKAIDAFPRQLERRDEPCAPLVEALWGQIKTLAVIPDATGDLKSAEGLTMPPPQVGSDLQEHWRELASDDKRRHWVHPSCLLPERTSRLGELAKRLERGERDEWLDRLRNGRPTGRLTRASAPDWFKAVADNESSAALNVLHLAEIYLGKIEPYLSQRERKELCIIPCKSGELCRASDLQIAPEGVTIPGQKIVAHELAHDPEGQRMLSQVFQVQSLDEIGWRSLLEKAIKATSSWSMQKSEVWEQFWARLRLAPENVQREFVETRRSEIHIRRRDGSWALSDEILTPGPLVQDDGGTDGNQAVLVDNKFHRDDSALIHLIGVAGIPEGISRKGGYDEIVASGYTLLDTWLGHVRENYRAQLDASKNPQNAKLRPLEIQMPEGWKLLSQLTGLPKAKLAARMFRTVSQLPPLVEFGHTTQGKVYQPIRVTHPMRWFLREHGTLAIGARAVPLKTLLKCLNKSAVQAQLREQSLSLDCLNNLTDAPALKTPSQIELKKLWIALIEKLATREAIAGDRLEELWRDAAADGVIPEILPGPVGPVPLAECYVTGSVSLAERGRNQGLVVIALDETTRAGWLKNGARNLEQEYRIDWDETLGEDALLIVAVPEVGEVLSDVWRESALCRSVKGLRLGIAGSLQAIPCIQWQGILHLDVAQLEDLSRAKRLEAILHELEAAGRLNKCQVP